MKILLTLVTFLLLAFLQMNNSLDPTIQKFSFVDESISKPLYGVCDTQSVWIQGFFLYQLISLICLGIVIFGTSKLVLCNSPFWTKTFTLVIYMILNSFIIMFFSFVPFFSHDGNRDTTFSCE